MRDHRGRKLKNPAVGCLFLSYILVVFTKIVTHLHQRQPPTTPTRHHQGGASGADIVPGLRSESDPSRQFISVQCPDDYNPVLVQALKDFWRHFNGDLRLSLNPDMVEKMKDILKIHIAKIARETHLTTVEKLAKAKDLARIYLVRYFGIKDHVDEIVESGRALRCFKDHVEEHIKELPLLKGESRIPELRTHFQSHFSIFNAQNFLFDVYTLLCVELKIHIDSPFRENHTWDDQLQSWDSIGNLKDDKWPDVKANDFKAAIKVRKLSDSASLEPTL
ncbi:hypothetical protein BDD12DRAFT_872490 [Trichophaea hybrida]|nr:hypothetical protein BDD12DRAFT_872490 [Trichophaea hybrida]